MKEDGRVRHGHDEKLFSKPIPNAFYHGVHTNSQLDFSDVPFSRDLALTNGTILENGRL
jgi:hypothetical protein